MTGPSGAVALLSVGHGTASEAELLDRLALGGVRRLVDIRTAPGSRRHPHLGRDALEQSLPAAGIGYRWDRRLGGFRKPAPDSPDVVWQNESFRGYAGHLRTDEARAGLVDLLADGATEPTAFLCSETVWWRCHRRLVADALVLLHGVPVSHLVPGRVSPHRPTPGARVEGSGAAAVLVYDDVDSAVAAGARPGDRT
jgi:uncharacterized protein (DUF488 family)